MQDLKQNERELIKQVNYFKKRAAKMLVEGKIGAEHGELIGSCESWWMRCSCMPRSERM